MVAGAVAGQAAKAAAGKTASGASKAAGKTAGSAAEKGGKFGIQTPSQERQSSAGIFLNKRESQNQNEDEEQNNSSNEMNYTGSGQTSNHGSFSFSRKNQNKKGKFDLKKLKKASPLIIGLLIITLPIILIFGTGALLFADIDENTQESMDVQYLAMRKVAQAATKHMLKTSSLPSTFADALTDSGLEVGYLDTNGTFIAGLRPNPENSITLASSSPSNNTNTNSSLVIRFKDQIIDADSWDYFAETNAEVYSKFKDATYGRAAGHYDNAANAFYSTINASRNVFANYTKTSTTDFRNILAEKTNNGSTTEYGVYDAEECVEENLDGCSNAHPNSSNTKSEAINSYFDALFDNTLVGHPSNFIHFFDLSEFSEDDIKYRDIVQATTIAYLVNAAINANETYESMRYFLTLEEVMSKTKAGNGANAPINEMLNYLTTADENGVSAIQSNTLSSVLTKSFSGYTGEEAKKDYSLDRTQNIIESFSELSEGALLALATTSIDISSNSSSSYGIQDKSRSLIKLWKEPTKPTEPTTPTKESYGCTNEETTPEECSQYNAAYSSYEKELKKYREELENYEKDMLYKTTEAYHTRTQKVIDELKKALSSDTSKTTFMNEDGNSKAIGAQSGELFSKGASILGSKIATFAEGGTIGTKESIAQYQKETNKLLAWEAEVERAEKSPFDITSQNTFLGSLAHSFSNYLHISTSLSSFSNIIKNSFASLLPDVFADNESSFQTTYGKCPESENESGNSSFSCSVYSYPQTTFNLDSLENFIATTATSEKESNKPTNHEDYIELNNQRFSNVGYINHDIAEKLWNDENWLNKGLGLGRQFGAFLKNKMNKSLSDYFSTYYNRFSDDQLAVLTGTFAINASDFESEQAYCAYSRFLDQIGYFSEENTNTAQLTSFFIPGTGKSEYIASLENYAEDFKNLSDTEYLARISGISKDEANLVLGYITYNSYLASIDHDSALAFGKKEEFNFEASNQSELTTQLAIFNSEAKTIDSSSKRREIAYVA